jgi:hypothetical protein
MLAAPQNETERLMFERNKIDTITQAPLLAVPAEVTFDDGEISRGKFLISSGRTFADALNAPTLFLEFEAYGEERRFVAKAAIRYVKLVAVPNTANLLSRGRDGDSFEPHQVLGVERGAEWADVRAAYFALSKVYHPDRYASVDLPAEVRDYLDVMSRRINLAYAALEKPKMIVKAIAQRPEPVYQSRPRF